jgi:hypothetical protein
MNWSASKIFNLGSDLSRQPSLSVRLAIIRSIFWKIPSFQRPFFPSNRRFSAGFNGKDLTTPFLDLRFKWRLEKVGCNCIGLCGIFPAAQAYRNLSQQQPAI